MERPTCKTCPYWEAMQNNRIDGQCFRYPPSIPSVDSQIDELDSVHGGGERYALFHGMQVVTMSEHWCGEHPAFPAYIASLKIASTSPNTPEQ